MNSSLAVLCLLTSEVESAKYVDAQRLSASILGMSAELALLAPMIGNVSKEQSERPPPQVTACTAALGSFSPHHRPWAPRPVDCTLSLMAHKCRVIVLSW